LVTWATERDILIRRAEQADATIATLRAELQAAQAVPLLPEGWHLIDHRGHVVIEHDRLSAAIVADQSGVDFNARTSEVCKVTSADLITVLRHAQAAQARLREQAHPTPAQEGE
jgi:hypothetical protein